MGKHINIEITVQNDDGTVDENFDGHWISISLPDDWSDEMIDDELRSITEATDRIANA